MAERYDALETVLAFSPHDAETYHKIVFIHACDILREENKKLKEEVEQIKQKLEELVIFINT